MLPTQYVKEGLLIMKQKIWGLILLALGILVLLQVTEVLYLGLSFWPVVLLLLGIVILWESISHGFTSWFLMGLGLWVGAIGLFNILSKAELTTLTGSEIVRYGWPLILVAIGLSILFGDRKSFIKKKFRKWGEGWEEGCEFDNWESYSQVRQIGDLYHGRTSWVLDQNHEFYHGIGDVMIDLTTADIRPGTHRIFIKVGIGELNVRIPDGVNIEVEGSVGLGELNIFGDKRSGFGGLNFKKKIEAPESEAVVLIKARMGIGELNVTYNPAVSGGIK